MVGAVIALFLDQGNAALILAGVALGAAAVSTVALAPVGDLLRKSAPLALPLLVIAVVGTIERDWWFALGTGVLFAVVTWSWIVAPDLGGGEMRLALRSSMRQLAAAFAAIAVAIGIAQLLLSAEVIADTLRARESIGNLATRLFVAGVLLWALALVIRLFAFGGNPARLAVSVSLSAAFLLLVVSAGVVDGPEHVLGLRPPALLAIAGCALLVEMASGSSRSRAIAGRRTSANTIVAGDRPPARAGWPARAALARRRPSA